MPLRPAPVHQRVLLPVRDPDLPAPVSRMVRQRSGQSAWSEITSGSSTPFWRARARTRIQPDAKLVTGSGNLRDQTSWIDEGGQSTIAPSGSARSAAATFGVSPSGKPRACKGGQLLHRPVQVDRPVVAGLAQQHHTRCALPSA